MRKVLGVAMVTLALAIIITPQFLNCGAQGHALALANGNVVPMKCTWTARAEIATGIPLLAIGIMMLFIRGREGFRYLGGLGALLGVFVMLLPTVLIGVCNGQMICHTVMQPSLLLFGSIVTAASLTGVIVSLRRRE